VTGSANSGGEFRSRPGGRAVSIPYAPWEPVDPLGVPRAAYVHVPFCVHRCGYCDFTVVAGRDDLISAYLDALACELSRLESPQPVETLFLGGGTPTHLPERALERLLELVRKWFPLVSGGEFSVEANPVGLSPAKLGLLADAGVNRVSLGVQSFDTQSLATLERDHSPELARQTVEAVRDRFPECSVDLIFGVPGQSLVTWQTTLETAIALGLTHLSAYGLTFEKGTAFWGRRLKGELASIPDELERSQYELAMELLPACGFSQYELSNYARAGHESRHNATYWANGPYFAAGPGAARYVKGTRETNHRSTTTWIKSTLAGRTALSSQETLSLEDRARETLMLGLRRTAGVFFEAFRKQTGYALEEIAKPLLARDWLRDCLAIDERRIALTPAGRCVADSVVAALWE
jgi:oxygen-independent coproporphyrinogen-3 oxidase